MPPEEAAAKVVEPEKSIVAGEEVEPDIMSLLKEDEPEEVKPVLDKTEKALIKFKQRGKETKRENEELKAKIAEIEKKLADRSLAKPDREQYDDDDKYTEDLENFITRKAAVSVEEVVAKRLDEQIKARENEEYLHRYETKILDKQEVANSLIIDHFKNKPESKAVLQSQEFMETLSRMPINITAEITTSPNVALILEYYTLNPQRFANLANGDSMELLNLGSKMAKIALLKGKKNSAEIIKPLQGGDNTAKRDPIKDHDKYILSDGKKDYKSWYRDMKATK